MFINDFKYIFRYVFISKMHEKYQNLKLYWLIYLDKHHGISNAKLYEGYNKYHFAKSSSSSSNWLVICLIPEGPAGGT